MVEDGSWRHDRTFGTTASRINVYLEKLERNFENIYNTVEGYEDGPLYVILGQMDYLLLNLSQFRDYEYDRHDDVEIF